MSGSSGDLPSPEEMERRIKELEADLAKKAGKAKFTEPSAAERTSKPVTPQLGWRDARKARKLREPVPQPPPTPPPWRASPPSAPAKSTRRRARSLLIAAAVIACLAGAVAGLAKLNRPSAPDVADNTPVTNGATPSGSPSGPGPSPTSFLPSPSVTAPFLGTPAQSYADSAAGIVIPPAHAVGSYSAEEVAAAYRTTKKLFIAANLNGPALAGGSPDAFADLLIPRQRATFVADLDKIGVNSRGLPRSTRGWITTFAPGSTQLVGSVIKVHGTMRATTGMNGDWHVLQIHADYLFVYAVERPDQPATLMRIVVRSVVDDDFADYDDPDGPLQPWWLLEGGGTAGARCDVADGFVHPQFPSGPADKVRPSGAPINPYDQNTPPADQACQATTGT